MNAAELRKTEGYRTADGHVQAARAAADAVAEGDLAAASEALAVVAAATKHVDERRKLDKAPSLEEGRTVDREYKELASPLRAREERLREMVGELAAAAGEGTIHPEAGGSITPTQSRQFRVVDASKVPRKFMTRPVPDERAIAAAVEGGADDIPGVEVWTDYGATVRR